MFYDINDNIEAIYIQKYILAIDHISLSKNIARSGYTYLACN